MSFLCLFLKGIVIGIAMIVPGVSGGVLAVILGVYDNLIYSLTHFFEKIKKNFVYLFILTIGILIGMIFFSNIILILYEKYEVIVKSAFIGLILGGVPYLFKEIKNKSNESFNCKILIITFILSIVLFLISKRFMKIENYNFVNMNFKTILTLFLAGFMYSVGKVIPGVSGSFILMIFGMYEYVLKLVANPFNIQLKDIYILIPFIIGFIIGVIVFLKLINFLLKKYFKDVYSMIIGFVLGSIVALIPIITSSVEFFISLFVLTICLFFSYKYIK